MNSASPSEIPASRPKPRFRNVRKMVFASGVDTE
jgi:hypothetical protein